MQHECAVVEHYFIRQRPLLVIEFQQTLPPPVPSLYPALSFIPFPCPSPLRRPRSEGGRVPAFASASPAAGERGGFPVITAEFTLDQTFHGNRSPRGGGGAPLRSPQRRMELSSRMQKTSWFNAPARTQWKWSHVSNLLPDFST